MKMEDQPRTFPLKKDGSQDAAKQKKAAKIKIDNRL